MEQIKAESSIQDKKKKKRRGLPCSSFGVDLKIIQGFAKTFLDMAYTIQFNNSITVESSLKMFLFLFFVLIRSFPDSRDLEVTSSASNRLQVSHASYIFHIEEYGFGFPLEIIHLYIRQYCALLCHNCLAHSISILELEPPQLP